jgi:axial budding pattern protein 2
MLDSPSTSTEEYSIPRRRSDFGPPRSPVQVHFKDEALTRQTSSSSDHSHISGILQAEAGERTQTSPVRPRLVPFTSANRVPVPQRQSVHSLGKNPDSLKAKRVSSQEAKVWRIEANQIRPAMPTKSDSSDELCMGLHYVQTLGGDGVDESTPSLPTVATTYVRSSFSSLESSHQGHGTETRRVLVRIGEKFKFRIQIPVHLRGVFYELRLVNGGPLPQFLRHDLNLRDGSIEFHGIPSPRDLGVFDVGVHVGDREGCVARTIIDVVGRT